MKIKHRYKIFSQIQQISSVKNFHAKLLNEKRKLITMLQYKIK